MLHGSWCGHYCPAHSHAPTLIASYTHTHHDHPYPFLVCHHHYMPSPSPPVCPPHPHLVPHEYPMGYLGFHRTNLHVYPSGTGTCCLCQSLRCPHSIPFTTDNLTWILIHHVSQDDWKQEPQESVPPGGPARSCHHAEAELGKSNGSNKWRMSDAKQWYMKTGPQWSRARTCVHLDSASMHGWVVTYDIRELLHQHSVRQHYLTYYGTTIGSFP